MANPRVYVHVKRVCRCVWKETGAKIVKVLKMKPIAILDTECYLNYWLCKFLNPETSRTVDFELYNGKCLDVPSIRNILEKYTLISFNGINYDLPMITYALAGATNEELKIASDRIILGDLRPWEFEREFKVEIPKNIDHIDLIEVAPGVMDSLKIYGGRMHTKKMQDLPIEPSATILPEQCALLREYCGNDLQQTAELFAALKKPLDLRIKMSAEYGIDLRSKSDAQIAETVICSEVQKKLDVPIKRSDIRVGAKFKYYVPTFISFSSDKLNAVLARFVESEFVINQKKKVECIHDYLSEPVSIRGTVYQLGMGGLHSKDESVYHKSDFDTQLFDIDATSFYPWTILVCSLYPKQLTEAFLDVFSNIVKTRIDAKMRGDVDTAESMKIMINGTFGKLGSWFSKLFSPSLMIQTTLTGQLVALMLIERLELAGIHVVSANTDGITVACPRYLLVHKDAVVNQWTNDTGFKIEEAPYVATYSMNVNSYIAIKPNNKFKRKGQFVETDLRHNPNNEIVGDALCAYLNDDLPVEETIRLCQDIRKFVTVRKVDGGAEKDGGYVGKAIRFYHSLATKTGIHYRTNGHLVPNSEGAMPLMQLPDEFPTDVNYDWYVREATEMLAGIGVTKSQRDAALYFDETLLELQ